MPPVRAENPLLVFARKNEATSQDELDKRMSLEKQMRSGWRDRIIRIARLKADDTHEGAEKHNPDSSIGTRLKMRDKEGSEYRIGFYRDMSSQSARVVLYSGDTETLVTEIPEDSRNPMVFDQDLGGSWIDRFDGLEELIAGAEEEIGIIEVDASDTVT